MTVVGLDDTDSRTAGMCTTYVGTRLAERLGEAGATVDRQLLIRLNPAIPYKTRGNAAVALHTDADPETAFAIAEECIETHAVTEGDVATPGLVVAPGDPADVPATVERFATAALHRRLSIETARRLTARDGWRGRGWGDGRGLVGATAAIGAWRANDAWTVERIGYRRSDRWGSDREVDTASVFEAATAGYPRVWDTVDRGTGDVVCVPHTPCPVLYGIRGEDAPSVRAVAQRIESEPVDRASTFLTNQGTDAHLETAALPAVRSGRSYAVEATVAGPPDTRRGGHVFVPLVDRGARATAAAFEPTKRFRDHVRRLRPGDRVLACGEVTDGTIKLEKLAIRSLVTSERVTPPCRACGRTMESAGRHAGYRCRSCGTTADRPEVEPVDRSLERGWYEVPPCARRHVAKPLIRGGFDAPVHPER